MEGHVCICDECSPEHDGVRECRCKYEALANVTHVVVAYIPEDFGGGIVRTEYNVHRGLRLDYCEQDQNVWVELIGWTQGGDHNGKVTGPQK